MSARDDFEKAATRALQAETRVAELDTKLASFLKEQKRWEAIDAQRVGEICLLSERVAQMGKESLEHQTRMQEYRAENTRLREALASALAKEPGWNQKANEALATTRQDHKIAESVLGSRASSSIESPALEGCEQTQAGRRLEVFTPPSPVLTTAQVCEHGSFTRNEYGDWFCRHCKVQMEGKLTHTMVPVQSTQDYHPPGCGDPECTRCRKVYD